VAGGWLAWLTVFALARGAVVGAVVGAAGVTDVGCGCLAVVGVIVGIVSRLPVPVPSRRLAMVSLMEGRTPSTTRFTWVPSR